MIILCEEVFFNKSDSDSEQLKSLKDNLQRFISRTQEYYKKCQRKKDRFFKTKTDWLDSKFDLPDNFKSHKSSKRQYLVMNLLMNFSIHMHQKKNYKMI